MDSDLLKKMQEQCEADSERWFPDASRDLIVHTLGLVGEAGEVADLVKKVARGSLSLKDARPLIMEELTDVLIYLLTLSQLMKMDLVAEYIRKRDINLVRFGDYTSEEVNGL